MKTRRFALDPGRGELHRATAAPRLPRHRPGELFLRGPIPWLWLVRAMQEPGKALHVGLAAWQRAFLRGRRDVVLNLSQIARAGGFDRTTAGHGLTALEEARLVSVVRSAGRCPRVTLLDFHGEEGDSSGADLRLDPADRVAAFDPDDPTTDLLRTLEAHDQNGE